MTTPAWCIRASPNSQSMCRREWDSFLFSSGLPPGETFCDSDRGIHDLRFGRKRTQVSHDVADLVRAELTGKVRHRRAALFAQVPNPGTHLFAGVGAKVGLVESRDRVLAARSAEG